MLSKFIYLKSILTNRIPPQLVIQFTNHCNARCPQCGMRASAKFPRSVLPKGDIKRILDAAASQGVQALSFTGGEPLLFLDDLIALMTYAGKIGIPFVRTGTNGFLLRHSRKPGFEDRIKRLAERLANTNVRNFWISIDSAFGDIHEQMRGLGGVIAGIEKALPIFNAAGLYPSANLGINRQVAGDAARGLHPGRFSDQQAYLQAFYEIYCSAFDRFYRFVRDLGFTIVNTCYPMSIGEEEQAGGMAAVYAATAEDDVVRFTPPEKAMLYKALLHTIPKHRRHLRIFSPLSSLYMLTKQHRLPEEKSHAFGCRGGVDFFFISAEDGFTYPCGYRGHENLGKFWQLDLARLKPNGDCHRCDWECFRDPSEMFAPLLQSLHQPLRLSKRFYRDRAYFQYWLEDMRYYKACGLFDGRRPMDPVRLKAF
jgi:MoaA/NifB/PqqE/SkfB family radical SAM enzyme